MIMFSTLWEEQKNNTSGKNVTRPKKNDLGIKKDKMLKLVYERSEGIATSFELSEAQSQLYQAQQDYLQAMLDVISYKAALEKVLDTSKYQPEDSQN